LVSHHEILLFSAFSAAALFALSVAAPVLAQEIPKYAPPPEMPADLAKLPTVVLMSMGGTIASRAADIGSTLTIMAAANASNLRIGSMICPN